MQEGRAKIADVGMAQIMSEDYYACSLTSQQGTFAWASPELLLREGRSASLGHIYLALILSRATASILSIADWMSSSIQAICYHCIQLVVSGDDCCAGVLRRWTSTR